VTVLPQPVPLSSVVTDPEIRARLRLGGADPQVEAIEVGAGLLRQVAPSKQEVQLCCHARQVNVDDRELAAGDSDGWFAVVMANRLPTPGVRHRACLVSLEQRSDVVFPAGPRPGDTLPSGTRRLVLLHTWTFAGPNPYNTSPSNVAASVVFQVTGTGALKVDLTNTYSGISANPALGAAVDKLVAHGGTAILSETPEVYGAEHLLTRRAVSREVGEKLLARIKWWEEYCARNGAAMDNNPSAGNKVGGLTTILEKSLGAVAKGGTTNLVEVYEYAQRIDAKGFVFMDSPGYDPMSATGQVASGANLICFTTGRGSAYGCAPSPSLKLATNTALWERQEEDMDINCGGVIDGSATIEQLGEQIFQMMLDCASGVASKSELHGYGQSEFVPWQVGVVT